MMAPISKKTAGFSLLELMIVLVIMGILATVAVHQFFGPKEAALEKEAITNLQLIAAAEKIYRMETGAYYGAANAGALNSMLSLMLPTQNPKWEYKVIGASASAFTAKACRVPVSAGKASLCINATQEDPVKTGCTW